jgi:histidyl-tRNA synthetase
MDVLLHCGGGSFKSQLKKADASGAEFAVIIGDDEALADEVQLKALRDETFGQRRVKARALADILTDYTSEIFDRETEKEN